MKIIIFILIWMSQIEAASLIYPNGKVEHFTQHIDKSRALKNNIYYKNGIISNQTRYQDTRKIYVSFGKARELTKFCQKYNLKFLKLTNKKFYTALFKLQNNHDIITLCSKINADEHVRYAKPHWKAPRVLK